MRLINVENLQLEEFIDDKIPEYAILSHTWQENEVSFTDFSSTAAPQMNQYQKIRYTCEQAKRDNIAYAWVDTCCIDKRSSAELSEAINSMFKWYKRSAICYAYLFDVSSTTFDEDFSKSRWFRRGWTLQELIAPQSVVFFDRAWINLGTKMDNVIQMSGFTGIPENLIKSSEHMYQYSIAQRMSWASKRRTTRVEDIAYCLLGIFNINMPLLYGEGNKAFARLQEEIIKKMPDDSILAWDMTNEAESSYDVPPGLCNGTRVSSLFATCPAQFENCSNVKYGSPLSGLFTLSSRGLEMQLYVIGILLQADTSGEQVYIGLLSCAISMPKLSSQYLPSAPFIGILLRKYSAHSEQPIMYRVKPSGINYTTHFVNARVASNAIMNTVIIIEDPSRWVIRDFGSWKAGTTPLSQVVINKESLKHLGYKVTVTGLSRLTELESRWDSKTEILSFPSYMSYSFVLHMTSPSSFPNFSVVICDTRTRTNSAQDIPIVIRNGLLRQSEANIIWGEVVNFDGLAESLENLQEFILVPSAEGKRGRISITYTEKWVLGRILCDVNIGVQEI